MYTNQAALSALRYGDAAELRGRSSHYTLHPYRPNGTPFPAAECQMLTPAVTGVPVHGDDEWFLRSDGTFFPASWWAAPIELPDGRGVVYSFFDATEKRELERAARRERDASACRAAEAQAGQHQRRIVECVTAARRQTARDLHDGAQQRLVSVLIGLKLTRELMRETASPAVDLLERSIRDTQTAIEELRELVAGIYPPILTTKGLRAAVECLAARCSIPVEVHGNCYDRLPAAVESNAYFVVSEALTNAVKHSNATGIVVCLDLGSALRISVSDDGVGGIPPEPSGSGLMGIADRVAVFRGTVTITSPAGAGTRIHAEIPLPVGE